VRRCAKHPIPHAARRNSLTFTARAKQPNFRQVVIYMSVYAGQRELDSRNGALVPAIE
jgi:hypothetical protein